MRRTLIALIESCSNLKAPRSLTFFLFLKDVEILFFYLKEIISPRKLILVRLTLVWISIADANFSIF